MVGRMRSLIARGNGVRDAKMGNHDGAEADVMGMMAEYGFAKQMNTFPDLGLTLRSGYRVHVGAINSLKNLLRCKELGAESCDGTGWFRGPKMTDTLHRYFKIQSGEEKLPEQIELCLSSPTQMR